MFRPLYVLLMLSEAFECSSVSFDCDAKIKLALILLAVIGIHLYDFILLVAFPNHIPYVFTPLAMHAHLNRGNIESNLSLG